MKVDQEPTYPLAGLEPCPTNLRSDACPSEQAERNWWTEMVIFGRTHHDRVKRICQWAVDLKAKLPAGYCG